jgi:PPIC-type PPIASE domain
LTIRLLREPLLQFLVLGAILFAIYSIVGKGSAEAPEKIVVSASRIENLGDGFARTWHRPPSKEELKGLIEDYIRDEVFYRAGRAAGLDRDDVIIRRRVRQKMEFLVEEISAPEPTEAQLAAVLTSNPDRFRTEDRLTFHQLFLNPSRRTGTIDRDLEQVRAVLSRGDTTIDTAGLGDPFLLGEEFHAISLRDTAGTFGDSFARQVFAAEHGRWLGPIASSFGQHFIYVRERTRGSVPPLDTIRTAVVRQWADARRAEAEQKLYRSLRDRYEITVEAMPAQAARARP